jgi:hypothetical protein
MFAFVVLLPIALGALDRGDLRCTREGELVRCEYVKSLAGTEPSMELSQPGWGWQLVLGTSLSWLALAWWLPRVAARQAAASQSALLMLLLVSCSKLEVLPSTNTSSSAFATLPEKVAFLERYVTFRRHYSELEYGVFYQSNDGCPPGPSEWDVSIIARVPPDELAVWTVDMKPVATRPPELQKLASDLDTRGVDTWYEAPGKAVGVDRVHAIVLYRASAR